MYILKMKNLVSLEIMLVNNLIGNVGLDEISKGFEKLKNLEWLVLDLK